MKINRPSRSFPDSRLFRAKLLTLCFFFVIGVVAGLAAHCVVDRSDDLLLREYILQYAQYTTAQGDITASVLSMLGVYFRYPVAIIAVGFTAAGLFLIPLLIVAQAFSAAFSVACFSSALGRQGLLLAFAAFGPRYLLLLPVSLLLAVYAMGDSARHLQRKKKPQVNKNQRPDSSDHLRTIVCAAVLLIGVAVELLLIPHLLKLALASIM